MKQITAVIQPARLGPVREALSLVGVTGMTLSDVRGFGSQGGSVDTYRGVEYRVDYVPKIQLDIVVSEPFVDPTIDAIVEAARTEHVGDGKIWVKNVESVIRVRTGERDEAALK
ncbi:MAG: P-II family nitrogen regulator [Dehalococcoidia bacterium]|jgi:nitrogen regulatory protein PII|nr:P-II family nitrogen regulator [Dehalococcoidia bacterium]